MHQIALPLTQSYRNPAANLGSSIVPPAICAFFGRFIAALIVDIDDVVDSAKTSSGSKSANKSFIDNDDVMRGGYGDDCPEAGRLPRGWRKSVLDATAL